MMKTGVLARAAMCLAFFAMTVMCVGCPENKPTAVGGGGGNVNFKGRTCPGGATQDYAIEVVDSKQVLNDPADNAIVVCEGDKVSWFIQSSTGIINITFADSYADDLFGKGHSKFSSHPGSQKSETDKQVVLSPNGHLGRLYKYTAAVQDKAGSWQIDPHVIPMGNGGP